MSTSEEEGDTTSIAPTTQPVTPALEVEPVPLQVSDSMEMVALDGAAIDGGGGAGGGSLEKNVTVTTPSKPDVLGGTGNHYVMNTALDQQERGGLVGDEFGLSIGGLMLSDREQKEYRKFEQELFGVLLSFENAREWADLSNCLIKLYKVFNLDVVAENAMERREVERERQERL